jgi:hypothetical protein
MLLFVDDVVKPIGHAFLSYVREDSAAVDRLQQLLEAAGIPVWRDTDTELWPGEDWRLKIRQAITRDALAFIACFSSNSTRRTTSSQNEELTLAIEQFRLRNPDAPWVLPVRLDDCVIPDVDIGGGRTLGSIQRVDLFGERRDEGIARLVASVLRILRSGSDIGASPYYSCFLSYSAQDTPFVRKLANDLRSAGISCWLDTQEIRVGEPIEQGIRRGLSSQDKLILVLSRFSVASRWVNTELRIARSLERERENEVVFPLRLDRSIFDASSPLLSDLVKTRHIGDFEGWQDEAEYSKNLRYLVRDLTISAALDSERGR